MTGCKRLLIALLLTPALAQVGTRQGRGEGVADARHVSSLL